MGPEIPSLSSHENEIIMTFITNLHTDRNAGSISRSLCGRRLVSINVPFISFKPDPVDQARHDLKLEANSKKFCANFTQDVAPAETGRVLDS